MTVLRDAYVRVLPDTSGFGDMLRRHLAGVKADREGRRVGEQIGDGFTRGLDGRLRDASGRFVAEGNRAGKAFGKGLTAGSAALGGFSGALAASAARATVFVGSIAAAAPAAAQLTAALAPAAGALVVLPAAMAAVKVASATLTVATMGVGSAITVGLTESAEKAEEELKKLPPAAAAFSRSIIALKPQLQSIRATVASRFFTPLLNDIKPLAGLYLPLAEKGMGRVAGALGGLGDRFAKAAGQAKTFSAVRSLFGATAVSVQNLHRAVGPVTAAFAALIAATAPKLPGIAKSFGDAAITASSFVTEAAESGRLTEIFRNAVATLNELRLIVSNVGVIFGAVFKAAGVSGGNLLANLRELTGQVAVFLQSGTGGSALTAVFGTLATLGQAMRTALGAVLPAIAESVQALAPAVSGLAPAFAQLVVAVAPLLPYFTQIAATVLTKVTPAIADLADWLTQHQSVLKGVVFAIGGFVVAQKAAAVASAAHAAILAVQGAGGLAAYLRGTTLVSAATKVWAGVQWLLNVALTANPIGLAVAAVAALGAAVVIAYQKSDTFRAIVQAAWRGIQTAVAYAWNNVIKPAVTALVTFFQTKIAPAAMWLWNNVMKPAFAGISWAVKAAWVVIQIALKAFQLYLTNVIFPVVRFLYNNVVKPVFSAIGGAISAWWNHQAKPAFNAARSAFSALGSALSAVWQNVLRPMFSAFGGFLTGTVAPAFRRGVDAIKAAWESVKNAAKVPVSFVVNSVVNPLVRGINKVAGFVGVKDRIPEIAGFARGGQIPGAPSFKDNLLGRGPNGPLALAAGEFVTNTRSTLANLPALHRINQLRRPATMQDLVDVVPDGRRRGGMVGDGIGDFFSGLWNGAKGVGEMVTDPKKALTRVAEAALARIPGGGAIRDMVRGMGKRLIDGVGSFLGGKLAGGSIGGAGIAGGWRGMQAVIARQFPGLGLVSGFRPGAITVTGNKSYHGMGRAVDYPPVRALAAWIKSTYGARTKELITPWQELNLHNGRPHHYTGRVWDTHNFAGGNAHVHWAAANGGLIGRRSGLPFGSYDSGGRLPTGLSLAWNGTGRPEPVGHHLTDDTETLHLLREILAALGDVGGDVAGALTAGTRRAVQIGRTAAPSTGVR